MDCEKFDRIVLDMLYDELDELTSAAAKRHLDQCSRCRGIGSGLRATREVGVLPTVEPPADLENRILAAADEARAGLPLRQRFRRAVSIVAGYAMRPQLAMAALLLLMIGSSLLLLRAKPGQRDTVQVTERGIPEPEGEPAAIVPLGGRERAADEADRGSRSREPAAQPLGREPGERRESTRAPTAPPAPKRQASRASADRSRPKASPAVASDDEAQYQAGLTAYNDGRYGEAVAQLDQVSARGGTNAAAASLYAAQAARISSGCRVAARRFERVNERFAGSGAANEATWQAADCYRVMGDVDSARRSYESLLRVAGYGERARHALDTLGAPSAVAARSRAAEAAAPAKSKRAKPTAKPKAKKPAAAALDEAF